VLIISYDTARRHAATVTAATARCGLLICDEGHRLKNGGSGVAVAVARVAARMRVVLTGTPVQNDLEELHAVCQVVVPGVLGDPQTFRKVNDSGSGSGCIDSGKVAVY
jgi:SNF2 family DNA or RNA helicase